MSIIIKDMKMPKTCKECPFSDHEAWCLIPGDWRERYYMPEDERSEHCPLIELPSHGRLIDAKQLKKKVLKWMPPDPCGVEEKEFPFETDICVSMIMEIDEAPTVLEAEVEE